jgi:hypothetical protein
VAQSGTRLRDVGPTATPDLSLRDLRTPEEIDELGQDWDQRVASERRQSPYLLSNWAARWPRERGERAA